MKCKPFFKKGTIDYYTNKAIEECAIRKFDLTEPVEIEFQTDHGDQYAPAGVRVFMNNGYTFFSTGQIPDSFADVSNPWFSKENNNKPHKMQHFNMLHFVCLSCNYRYKKWFMRIATFSVMGTIYLAI